MKSNKKQIEEMAKDCYYVAHLLRFNDPYMLSLKGWSELTKEMIKLGWIKPTEDSVVLSREEFNDLKYAKIERDRLNKSVKYYQGLIEDGKLVASVEVKEMAEKYFHSIIEVLKEAKTFETIDIKDLIFLQEKNKEIAKQCGVEIGE